MKYDISNTDFKIFKNRGKSKILDWVILWLYKAYLSAIAEMVKIIFVAVKVRKVRSLFVIQKQHTIF